MPDVEHPSVVYGGMRWHACIECPVHLSWAWTSSPHPVAHVSVAQQPPTLLQAKFLVYKKDENKPSAWDPKGVGLLMIRTPKDQGKPFITFTTEAVSSAVCSAPSPIQLQPGQHQNSAAVIARSAVHSICWNVSRVSQTHGCLYAVVVLCRGVCSTSPTCPRA
jgi:hypothetical protein